MSERESKWTQLRVRGTASVTEETMNVRVFLQVCASRKVIKPSVSARVQVLRSLRKTLMTENGRASAYPCNL